MPSLHAVVFWVLVLNVAWRSHQRVHVAAAVMMDHRSVDPIFEHSDVDVKPLDGDNVPDITVGVYYYPWHQNDFHNGQGYLRDLLQPRQEPYLGEYDDSNPKVIAQHLKWSRQANVRLWITSWFGPDHMTDLTIRNVILPHEQLHNHKIAVHYETNNRIKKKDRNNIFENSRHYYTLDGSPDDPNDGVAADMVHFCKHYFWHPNYYRINGRPVVVVYLTRELSKENHGWRETQDEDGQGEAFEWKQNELLKETIDVMRSTTLKECGVNPYIIGDHVYNSYRQSHDVALELLDAVTNYDVYGHTDQDELHNADGYGGDDLEEFFSRQAEWKEGANKNKCAYIPAVSPGFNDRGVRIRNFDSGEEKLSLSRRLRENCPEGSLFAKSLEYARKLVDKKADSCIFVTSWNEFHEDTQIEPVVVDRVERAVVIAADGTPSALANLESTDVAWNIWNNQRTAILDSDHYTGPDDYLTQGLAYEAYSDLYLNILRNATILPLFTEWFESFNVTDTTNPVKLSSSGDATIQSTPNPGNGGSKSLELRRQNSERYPRISISIDNAYRYNYLIIDFKFYSERSEAGEPLVVGCSNENDVGWDSEPAADDSWEFGRDYHVHRNFVYAVTECNITNAKAGDVVLVNFQFEATDNMTAIVLDDISITGLAAPLVTTRKFRPRTR